MLSQMMRSSRGLLLIGAVLAIAAFALVVVLLNKNNNTTSTSTATPTVSLGTSPTVPVDTATPVATATPTFVYIVALKDVPAHTRFGNPAEVSAYFKDVTPPSNSAIPADVVPGIAVMESKVLTNTIFLGYIEIVNPIKKSNLVRNSDYRILPFSPPNSLSYQVGPGHVAESVNTIPPQAADYGGIINGDFVDILLTVHQHELDSLTDNPPNTSAGGTGPVETQQLISGARVVQSFALSNTYTLELPLQDALLMKYVRDTGGLMDLVLLSADDVRNQAAQPQTNAVIPETFLTPLPQPSPGRGTPQVSPVATQIGGVANAFQHFPTPVPTPVPPKP